VILLKRRGEVVGLAIWSLMDGRLLYSDVAPSEAAAPPPDVIARAREGKPFVVPGMGHAEYADTLVVYYPYDANGDGTTDAVAKVILPGEEVTGSVARSTRLLYLGGTIVLLLAIAGILQVRRRQIGQDYVAVHDALTGLGNRLLIRRVSPSVLPDATSESPAALLLIDLDDFKAVNDTLGHHVGDEVLVAAAERIQAAGEPSGIAVRLGGDEFAVLLPHVSDRDQAHEVAGRIRDAVRRPFQVAGYEVEVDVSIGLAWAPTDGAELGDLMRSADAAMYQAKQSGGGVTEYEQVAEVAQPPSASTVLELSQALTGDELDVFYQPVRGANGRVTSVEALPRWHHPRRGLLEAHKFIPAVAHTSLMSTLTEWVLRRAARQCAYWRASGLDIDVSINVSARSLYNESLVELVRAVAEEHGLPLSALGLEVTEAVLVRDPVRVLSAMRRLRSAGVGLCIDNVGAIYGAGSMISEAPVDRLKIAGRYSGRFMESPLAATMVGAWARFGHQLGLIMIAQAVETPVAGRHLIDLGYDGVQGYGICRPMPAAELNAWLAQSTTQADPAQPSDQLQKIFLPGRDGHTADG
jgi:diguanylate cyclase (GGDEF)-like protein